MKWIPYIHLKWIDSYLSDHYQCVEINGSLSEIQVTSGVRHGSHIFPVLFYADDLRIDSFVSSDHNTLQADLNNFSSWCSLNHQCFKM